MESSSLERRGLPQAGLQGFRVPILVQVLVDALRVHAVQPAHAKGSDAVANAVWCVAVRSYEGCVQASGRAKPDSCAGAM